MQVDVLIIGAGLFGQVIAKQLREIGRQVMLVDAGYAHSGSRPSACLMKPSWMGAVAKADQEASLLLLDRHYGVKQVSFKAGPIKLDSVHWVNPRQILGEYIHDKVTSVIACGALFEAQLEINGSFQAKVVIVAAGVWSSELLTVPGLKAQAGASCLWKNASIEQPFISVWAPYKQVVAFNMEQDLWVGDGSALNENSWTEQRQAQTAKRCADHVGRDVTQAEVLMGLRPYVPKGEMEGRPCYLVERLPGLWIATGGAKNGTIAAGWAAHELGNRLS